MTVQSTPEQRATAQKFLLQAISVADEIIAWTGGTSFLPQKFSLRVDGLWFNLIILRSIDWLWGFIPWRMHESMGWTITDTPLPLRTAANTYIEDILPVLDAINKREHDLYTQDDRDRQFRLSTFVAFVERKLP